MRLEILDLASDTGAGSVCRQFRVDQCTLSERCKVLNLVRPLTTNQSPTEVLRTTAALASLLRRLPNLETLSVAQAALPTHPVTCHYLDIVGGGLQRCGSLTSLDMSGCYFTANPIGSLSCPLYCTSA